MPDILQNIEKVKPFLIIEVKVKTKYKKYLAHSIFDLQVSYVHFKGVELDDNIEDITTYEQAMQLLNDQESVDKYFSWTNVVDITTKRLIKNIGK